MTGSAGHLLCKILFVLLRECLCLSRSVVQTYKVMQEKPLYFPEVKAYFTYDLLFNDKEHVLQTVF